ncbi:proline dehydrogenase [Agyrium rufum]|nr:proline dehydrogenase [Agyrium rufum]
MPLAMPPIRLKSRAGVLILRSLNPTIRQHASIQCRIRGVHSTTNLQSTTAPSPPSDVSEPMVRPTSASSTSLSLLPFPVLLRSYLITALSSHPVLLNPAMRILAIIAHSSSPLFSPDKNPLLHFLLKKTFYAQFCAGETCSEVAKTMKGLKSMGYRGVILGYAREVVRVDKKGDVGGGEKEVVEEAKELVEEESSQSSSAEDLAAWRSGTEETVRCATKGDMVALKFTGAGAESLTLLEADQPPSAALDQAITSICDLAAARGVKLLFDAEQQAVQVGIDTWTLKYMRRYNCLETGRALVYGTYQAYLRSTPTTLANHLKIADAEGFTLGVKLVRGAYLGSDPRWLMWAEKEETDKAYNAIAEALMRKSWNDVLKPAGDGSKDQWPDVNLVLASHNMESVQRAMNIREQQVLRGEKPIDMVYGQLMGMADNVSCTLIQAGKQLSKEAAQKGVDGRVAPMVEMPRPYKYIVWGTVGECLKYLLRRAEENRDAVTRTADSRRALQRELRRRLLW